MWLDMEPLGMIKTFVGGNEGPNEGISIHLLNKYIYKHSVCRGSVLSTLHRLVQLSLIPTL